MTRGPKREALFWKYFEKSNHDGSDGYKCLAADCSYFNKGRNGTTLQRHLSNTHPEIDEQIQAKKAKLCERPIQSFGITTNPFKEIFHNKLAELFTSTQISETVVESPEFKSLLSFLNPKSNDHVLSRSFLNSLMRKKFFNLKAVVQKLISETNTISLSTDIWSKKNYSYSFLGVTMQIFVNSKLLNIAIDLKQIPQPHTSEMVMRCFSEVLVSWGIEFSKVSRITTDEGSNMIKAFSDSLKIIQAIDDCKKRLEKSGQRSESDSDYICDELDISSSDADFHESVESTKFVAYNIENFRNCKRISCLAHILNSTLKTVLDKSDVACTKASILNLIKKISMSCKKIEFLESLGGRKIVKIATTRWNSLYFACQRLLELRQNIILLCDQFNLAIEFEWTKVIDLCELLKPFADATNIFQSNNFAISKSIPALLDILDHLTNLINKKHSLYAEAELIKNHLTSKTSFTMDPNDPQFDSAYLISSLLDPQQSIKLTNDLFDLAKLITLKHFKSLIGSSETEFEQSTTTRQNQRRSFSTTSVPENSVLNQINNYIYSIESEKFDFSVDALEFWIANKLQYPQIYQTVTDMLSIQPSSASVERMFSICGYLSSGRKSKVGPWKLKIRTLCCYNKFLN